MLATQINRRLVIAKKFSKKVLMHLWDTLKDDEVRNSRFFALGLNRFYSTVVS
jgi:hypothetical protein